MPKNCIDCQVPIRGRGRHKRCAGCRDAYRRSPEVRTRTRARSAVYIEISAGRLVRQTCEALAWGGWRCGRSPTYAHHEDYSAPLDVVWLCTRCHHSRHSELRLPNPPPLQIERPGMPAPDRDW
jgi:hypothetical protein